MSTILIVALASILAGSVTAGPVFETIFEWNLINYDLPQDAYIPENNLFTGLEVHWDRIFLALPNLKTGVPATLTWLPRPDAVGAAYPHQSPPLQPYPSWEFQGTAGNCTGLVSAYRIRVDRCDRLWVLDSGVITTLDNFSPVCPPKIMVFDLKTDTLIRSTILPREVLRPNTLLTNLEIDYEITAGSGAGGGYYSYQQPAAQSCDDAFIYMTDTANAGIIVYDIKKDSAWRFFHPNMLPHPEHCTYNIAGESFTLPDAVVGIALSPETRSQYNHGYYGYSGNGGQRVLYFQPFGALRIFSIPTSVLQTPPQPDADLKIQVIYEKSSQSAALACDPIDGTLFFNPVTDLSIQSLTPGARQSRVVVQDTERLQFSSDIVIAPRDNYNIWFVTSRFQRFFRQTYDPREINFRIMRIKHSVPQDSNSLVFY